MKPDVKGTLLGMLIGVAGNFLGFFVYGLAFKLLNNVSFKYFYEVVFQGTDHFKSQIITGALLVNILIFYVFMRKKKDALGRGIMIIILLSVIGIVYYFQ